MVNPMRRLEEALLGRSGIALLEEVLSSLKGDEVVVDAGCGSGFLSLPIAAKLNAGTAICVDLSHEMLAGLHKKSRRQGFEREHPCHQGGGG